MIFACILTAVDSNHLTAHLATVEPQWRADRVITAECIGDDVFDELRGCLRQWDGEDLSTLFTSATCGHVAYALARLVFTAPGFTAAAPGRADEIGPVGADEFERVVAGDLQVDGAVDMYDGEALIVLGNLHATSVSADETAHVIVAGTMTARTIWSEGDVLAHDVDAQVVYGSYSAGLLGVSDTVRTRLLVNSQQHDAVLGRIDAEFVVDENRHPHDSPELQRQLDELAARVPPAVVDTGDDKGQTVGRVDMRALLRHVENDGSPFA
jgi:hypothetical protein